METQEATSAVNLLEVMGWHVETMERDTETGAWEILVSSNPQERETYQTFYTMRDVLNAIQENRNDNEA